MREIKFRAFDIKNKLMNTPFTISDTCSYEMDWQNTEDNVIMQYTGIKDKNGKEIWEGDIVKVWIETAGERSPLIMTFEVKFQAGAFSAGPRFGWRFEECEVLGNIYENPELLESK